MQLEINKGIYYKPISVIILILFHLTIFGQEDKSDEFSKSKEIIRDLGTIVNPNGVQQNFQAKLGGIDQWIYVRGQDKNNPVIIFVHGGPASPMAPVMWMFQRPLEEYFTIVNYDQRASGKTFLSNDTTNLGKTLTIDRYANDLIALSELIKEKYSKKKVILIGHSWGTVVAMKAVLKNPALFYAYIGIGQVISTKANERISFNYGLEQAKKKKDTIALKELLAIAPYPGNEPITRERIIIARKWPQFYGGLSAFRNNTSYYFEAPLLSPEYSAEDVKSINQGSLFTLDKILPEFLSIDYTNIKDFPIPVFMFMGRHDFTTPSEPTNEWINNVNAPIKEGIWFENSAHMIPFEEPGKMLITLINKVRPLSIEN